MAKKKSAFSIYDNCDVKFLDGNRASFDEMIFEIPDAGDVREIGKFSPVSIQRWIEMASALEPFIIVDGKTTHLNDLNKDQKCIFFLSGGINIGHAFRNLAEAVFAMKDSRLGQKEIYQYALYAQLCSKLQRKGGRLNQGIIKMLVPLVCSQILYLEQNPNPNNIFDVFSAHDNVLKNTTEKDVDYLTQTDRLSFTMSGLRKRAAHVKPWGAKTVFEYYRLSAEHPFKQSSDIKFCYEMTNGLPTVEKLIKNVLEVAAKTVEAPNLKEIFQKASEQTISQMDYPYHPPFFADCQACALYLFLSHHPDAKVIC